MENSTSKSITRYMLGLVLGFTTYLLLFGCDESCDPDTVTVEECRISAREWCLYACTRVNDPACEDACLDPELDAVWCDGEGF